MPSYYGRFRSALYNRLWEGLRRWRDLERRDPERWDPCQPEGWTAALATVRPPGSERDPSGIRAGTERDPSGFPSGVERLGIRARSHLESNGFHICSSCGLGEIGHSPPPPASIAREHSYSHQSPLDPIPPRRIAHPRLRGRAHVRMRWILCVTGRSGCPSLIWAKGCRDLRDLRDLTEQTAVSGRVGW